MSAPNHRQLKARFDVALLVALVLALVEGATWILSYRHLPVGPFRFFTAAIAGYAALMALGAGLLAWLFTLVLRRPAPAAALGTALAWFAMLAWRGFGIAAVLDTGPTITKDVAAAPSWPVYAIAGGIALGIGIIAWLLATRKSPWLPRPLVIAMVLLVVAGVAFLTRGDTAPTLDQQPATVTTGPSEPLFNAGDTNLLLITVDTLRADHTSAYGYGRDTSPVLAGLGERGVRFGRCITQRTNTAASIAALFTGLYPPTNRTMNNRDLLQDFNHTLAEQFKEQGFRTAAFVTVPVVGPRFNFDQGFDQFKMLAFRIPEDELAESRIVNRSAFNWLTNNTGEQFFLWLHYKDPHSPYLVPPKYKDLYLEDDTAEAPGEEELLMQGTEAARRENARYFISQYDAEIRFIDENLGLLFQKLDELGVREKTLVVLTADHGEDLGEHGEYFSHGGNCYEPTAGVPLYFLHPSLPGGRLVTDTVSLVDVLPTLRELFGLPADPGLQGNSLAGLVTGRHGSTARQHHFTIGSYRKGYQTHAVTTDRHKLVMNTAENRVATDLALEKLLRLWTGDPLLNTYRCRVVDYELYDLKHDPEEMEDLAGQGVEAEGVLQEALWEWMDRTYRRGAVHEIRQGDLTPKLADQLRALGYLDRE